MTDHKVVFFSMRNDLIEKIKQYYIDRDIYEGLTSKNHFEYHFSLEIRSGAETKSLIPPFGWSNFAGEGDGDLEDFLRRLAMERDVTVSVAESCTGGLVAHRITNVPGSSDYFKGGVVAYSNRVKTTLLRVSREQIERHGAVSSHVAEEMCRGVAQVTGSDYAVSITGIAGPSGGTEEKPVGTVWLGLITPFGTEMKRLRFTGTRGDIKVKASSYAIFDLVKKIRKEKRR